MAALSLSCIETNPSIDIESQYLDAGQKEIWVCYHPGTKHHDKECIEKEYPEGCYVKGDNNKFCWHISRDECFSGDQGIWANKACKLFE